MLETGSNTIENKKRLTIRISKNSLSFAVADTAGEQPVRYEPFILKSGISLAANMREAFKSAELLSIGYQRVQVMIQLESGEQKSAWVYEMKNAA